MPKVAHVFPGDDTQKIQEVLDSHPEVHFHAGGGNGSGVFQLREPLLLGDRGQPGVPRRIVGVPAVGHRPCIRRGYPRTDPESPTFDPRGGIFHIEPCLDLEISSLRLEHLLDLPKHPPGRRTTSPSAGAASRGARAETRRTPSTARSRP